MNPRDAVSDVWRDLMHRHRRGNAAAQAVLNDLERAYGEPHRHYHTLTHIAELLQLLKEHGGCASDPDAVRLAILFHDIVYDPARADNEAASANVAVARLTALGFSDHLVAKVGRLILATAHGVSPPPASDADLHLLLDLDLSVLAAPPERYKAYARAIRREYGAVPDDLYRPGRRHVLEAFMARQRIFLTDRLSAHWEEPARANLAGEITELAGEPRQAQGQTCT